MTWHDPLDTKKKNQTPEIPSFKAMKENVIYGFPIGFAHAALVKQHQAALSKIVNSENFS